MSTIFYRDKPIIGLDISKIGVKIMSIDKNKMLVRGYGSISLDPEEADFDNEQAVTYISEKIKEMLREKIVGRIESNRVAVSIPTRRTFSRTFTLPVKEEKNIKSAVALEAEQYIPIPVDSLYLDYQVISKNKDEIAVLMCASPKKIVDDLLNIAENCGLEIALMEPGINSTARLLTRTEEGALPTVIVDIGPAETDIAILDSVIRVTGGLSIGGHTLTLDLANKMNLSAEAAHQFKVLNGLAPGARQAKIMAALKPSLDKIVTEVKRVNRYYTERFPDEKKLEQVLIVGAGSNIPGLGDFFTNELMMPSRVASPWQSLKFGTQGKLSKQSRSQYTVAAGLALIKSEDVR